MKQSFQSGKPKAKARELKRVDPNRQDRRTMGDDNNTPAAKGPFAEEAGLNDDAVIRTGIHAGGGGKK